MMILILVKDLVKYKPKVLIIGGSGQVGSEIQSIQNKLDFEIYFPTSQELNLLRLDTLEKYLEKGKFNLIINLAAFTDVELAEIDKEKANIINNLALNIIAKEANKKNIGLIHTSTDYVFGNKNGPHNFTDKKNPINYYGLTKSLGEDAILKEHNRSMIIRFASVFSEFGDNFIKKIANKILTDDIVSVVSDQKISLTYAGDFSINLSNIIQFYYSQSFDNFDRRLFHLSSDGYTDWYNVAKIVHNEIINFDNKYEKVNLIPISSKEWHSKVKRSSDSRLKIDNEFINLSHINVSNWKDSVKFVVKKILPTILEESPDNE